ncbi:MAG: anthranilate synthase component I family protein [Bacteroidota bacterium]
MNRQFRSFSLINFDITKKQVLCWAHQSGTCVFLDNHRYHLPHHQHECLVGAGIYASLNLNRGGAIDALQSFIDLHQDWCFGHLGYELQSETEEVNTQKINQAGFPDLFFFIPQVVVKLNDHEIQIGSFSDDQETILEEIQTTKCEMDTFIEVEIKDRIVRSEYMSTIDKIKHHILRGDCYELNYCMEFFSENTFLDPLFVYTQLTACSPNPFSAYYRNGDKYLLSASPERYLSKQGRAIYSQPIKGTIRRDLTDIKHDVQLKETLKKSNKDRSENVMVVDLVRNDLSRVCEEGSVKVEELFEVYTFPHLHHMISTISGVVREGTKFSDYIRASFPMGSMTGAPKKKVMELIDKFEPTARGIFSGALGYITPEGDFDFNVVIRSMVYNENTRYLSYHVGSGITGYSNAEKEYEECLIKAQAIKKVLGVE